jgi:hypothetical protein
MRVIQSLLALCSAASVFAAPTTTLETRQTSFNGKNLKVLPLGDSITVSISTKLDKIIENQHH